MLSAKMLTTQGPMFMTEITRYLLDDQPKPFSHYCHGVRSGNHLWISGTVGITLDGHVPHDVVEQFEVAMGHLDGVLRTAGGEPRHVVKVQIFLTEITDRTKINPVRERYFGEHRPASTLVEISALVDPRMKVEIEAEAVID